MSHVTKVNFSVKTNELKYVKSAAAKLGLEFKEGQTSHKWYGRWVNDYNEADAAYNRGVPTSQYGKCAHAIGLPNNKEAYEVGVIQEANGDYGFVMDFFAGGYGICDVIGAKGERLTQEIAAEKWKDVGETCGMHETSRTYSENGEFLEMTLEIDELQAQTLQAASF